MAREPELRSLSGRDLWRLGEEVQRFSGNYTPPRLDEKLYPIYLGGWPSANFFAADQGQFVLSTLLYSGQVLVKDPLSDWFAPEKYKAPHLLSDRQGYLDNEGKPNISGTRRFLANVLPAVRAFKPLIESGAVVLVPGDVFFMRQKGVIESLRSDLYNRLARDPEAILRRFHPSDMAVDDRRRGAFVFAGGERVQQLGHAIDTSLRYFAREWLLAQAYGAEYVASWPYEQYLCEDGLGRLLGDNEHYRTVNALLHSQLPVFQGLEPKIVAEVRNDEIFADFRANLFEVYRSISDLGSGEDYSKVLGQTEETLLRPVLDRAKREAKHGLLHRLGVSATEIMIAMGMRLVFDQATGHVGWGTVASEGVGVLAERVRISEGTRRSVSAWTKLYRHHSKVEEELRHVEVQQATLTAGDPWAIGAQPTSKVTVTPGLLFVDDPELPAADVPAGFSQGDYGPCECGSGLKRKFCC